MSATPEVRALALDALSGEAGETPRRAWPWLVGIFLLALLLRGFAFSRVELSHYDEGVYALSALSIADPAQPSRLFPGEERFAPPVYFSLAGAAARASGAAVDRAAIGLNVWLGALTALALALVARRWFGDAAGIAAGILLATSEFHVSLSRMALTDVAFALFFLLAIAVLVEAFARRSAPLVLLGGLATGLAWNTKYHGWLAVAIVALALLPEWFASLRTRRGDALRIVLLLALATAAACLAYLPWALYVESEPGGYAGLVAYQKTMLRSAWFDNALRQGMHQWFFEGPVSRSGLVLAFTGAVAVLGARFGTPRRGALFVAGLALVALTLGAGIAIGLFALFALPSLLRGPAEETPAISGAAKLGGRAVAAWLLVWVVLTPTYHPYARLVLPFTLASALAAGAFLARRAERLRAGPDAAPAPWIAAAAALLVLAVGLALPDFSHPWRATHGSREAAGALMAAVPPGARVIVLGEPNVAFYLEQAGRSAFESVTGKELPALLEAAREEVFVVTGIYAGRTGAIDGARERLGERLTRAASARFEPTDVRLLDDFAPRRAIAFHRRPTREYELGLWRVAPPRDEPPLVPPAPADGDDRR